MAEFMQTYNEQIMALIEKLKKASTPAEALNLAKTQNVLLSEMATADVKTYEEIKEEVASSLADQCESTSTSVSESTTEEKSRISTIILLLSIIGVAILLVILLRLFK